MPNQIFLFLSHNASRGVLNAYKKLLSETKDIGECCLIFHCKEDGKIPRSVKKLSHYPFSSRSISLLNYPMIGPTIVPGHGHFPLFQFFRDNPDFDYYWLLEHDVRFSGNWRNFFLGFNSIEKDFVSANIRKYQKSQAGWIWWESLAHPQESIAVSKRLASFNPVFRISNSSLLFLDSALKDGWRGHHEVLLPTLLYHNGFQLMDIGDTGKFVPPELTEKFYLGNTFRYRPPFWQAGPLENKIYHPVKPLPWVILWHVKRYLQKLLVLLGFMR